MDCTDHCICSNGDSHSIGSNKLHGFIGQEWEPPPEAPIALFIRNDYDYLRMISIFWIKTLVPQPNAKILAKAGVYMSSFGQKVDFFTQTGSHGDNVSYSLT